MLVFYQGLPEYVGLIGIEKRFHGDPLSIKCDEPFNWHTSRSGNETRPYIEGKKIRKKDSYGFYPGYATLVNNIN